MAGPELLRTIDAVGIRNVPYVDYTTLWVEKQQTAAGNFYAQPWRSFGPFLRTQTPISAYLSVPNAERSHFWRFDLE